MCKNTFIFGPATRDPGLGSKVIEAWGFVMLYHGLCDSSLYYDAMLKLLEFSLILISEYHLFNCVFIKGIQGSPWPKFFCSQHFSQMEKVVAKLT